MQQLERVSTGNPAKKSNDGNPASDSKVRPLRQSGQFRLWHSTVYGYSRKSLSKLQHYIGNINHLLEGESCQSKTV